MTDPQAPDRTAVRAHRRRLAVPMLAAAVLLGGYTLLWFQGARIMRTEIGDWIAAERAAGRSVAHGDITVRGYPGSLRAKIGAPAWSDPGAWSWSAETLYIVTQPLNPRRLLLTPRGEQAVRYAGRAYAVRAGDLRIALEEGSFAVEAGALTAESGRQSLSLGALRANWTGNDDGTGVLGLSLAQALYADGTGEYWVPQFNAALSEGTASDLALDAFEGAVAPGREVRPAFLSGEGRLAIGGDGYPAGRLTVTLRNAEAVTAVLRQAGAIDDGQAGMATALLGGFADDQGASTLPLVFADGKLRLGPVAVADLPRF